MHQHIEWPEGKKFAFTVFDDSDHATLENVKDIYSFFTDCGFRTTKSVWPVAGRENPQPWLGGATCADAGYLAWVKHLQASGFEIGFHNGNFHSAVREETRYSVDTLKELFGHDPSAMANHYRARQNIYWGDARLTGLNRFAYNVLTRFKNRGAFKGHVEGDDYFWGDICRDRVKYVRNFAFRDINTLKKVPFMPYHDPLRPYVNYWYASSDGGNIRLFNKCISEASQDRLEEEGGACIMYAFFAKGFREHGAINTRFKFLMERLARKNGWFVPVSDVLNHLLRVKGPHTLTDTERRWLERRWLLGKLRTGTT